MAGCSIISGDGQRVFGQQDQLAGASPLLRRLLQGAQDQENPEVSLPQLDGDTVETLVRLISGEVAVDLQAPGNSKLLAGAELLGIIPTIPASPISLASLMAQVYMTFLLNNPMN